MSALSDQVHDYPMALTDLNLLNGQVCQLGTTKAASHRIASIAQSILLRSPSPEAQFTNGELCSKLNQFGCEGNSVCLGDLNASYRCDQVVSACHFIDLLHLSP